MYHAYEQLVCVDSVLGMPHGKPKTHNLFVKDISHDTSTIQVKRIVPPEQTISVQQGNVTIASRSQGNTWQRRVGQGKAIHGAA